MKQALALTVSKIPIISRGAVPRGRPESLTQKSFLF